MELIARRHRRQLRTAYALVLVLAIALVLVLVGGTTIKADQAGNFCLQTVYTVTICKWTETPDND